MVYKLQLHNLFRLFLTMEVNPKVPKTLLRSSYVLVFEPPSGIKASLTRSYTQAITAERSDSRPIQRSKMHFIVAWFNAVVQERLRYIPIGWSKFYEFNQADQKCVLVCVDQWIDSMGKGREAIDPDKIPWDALQTMVSQSIFGGKIDNQFDQKILQSLVEYYFRKETYDVDYPLYNSFEDSSSEQLVIPDYKTYADFFGWTKQLPNVESPAWSGLPMNVEKLNQIKAAELLIFNTNVIQGTGDDLDQGDDEGENAGAKWMITLKQKVARYYDVLPLQLDTLKRVGHMVKNPLFRFLEREVSVLSSLLQKVRSDLKLVMDVCTGEKKSSNYTRSITEPLCAEKVPEHWKKYIVPAQMTATEWITDFQRRVDQVQKLASSGNQDSAIREGIWFGGLLAPEAYLIATQQATAQQHGWSLEELELKVDFDPA